MPGAQPGDLGDQDRPVDVVRPLQTEILPPVQEQLGGRVVAQTVAQPAELAGILLVKVDRLEVEPVQQRQAAKPVGASIARALWRYFASVRSTSARSLRIGVLRPQLGFRVGELADGGGARPDRRGRPGITPRPKAPP